MPKYEKPLALSPGLVKLLNQMKQKKKSAKMLFGLVCQNGFGRLQTGQVYLLKTLNNLTLGQKSWLVLDIAGLGEKIKKLWSRQV